MLTFCWELVLSGRFRGYSYSNIIIFSLLSIKYIPNSETESIQSYWFILLFTYKIIAVYMIIQKIPNKFLTNWDTITI